MSSANVIFWIFAFVTIFFALMTVLMKNLIHSALFMILSFVGVAGLFVLLNADFLATVQIIVYVGAISVFIIMGIMVTQRKSIRESNPFGRYKIAAGLVAVTIFAVIGTAISKTKWAISTAPVPESTVKPLADLLMKDFVIPFEVAALLLTMAMIGAIIIAKGVRNTQ